MQVPLDHLAHYCVYLHLSCVYTKTLLCDFRKCKLISYLKFVKYKFIFLNSELRPQISKDYFGDIDM